MPPSLRQEPHGQLANRGGLIGLILAWCAWWHHVLVRRGLAPYLKSCLDAGEETLNSLLRESLSITQRAINGASAWTLSVFNRDYKAQLRGRWQVLQEQYSWWGQTETSRSTLNAVLARNYDEDGSDQDTAPVRAPAVAAPAAATAAAAPAGAAVSQAGLRQRQPGSKKPQEALHTQHATHGHASISEIEPLPEHDDAQPPDRQHPRHQQQQQHAAGAPADAGVAQWFGQRATWLSDIADEATEAAAAAQEAATAAVQQAATSVSNVVEEAAATAASWARSMRAVFVEPPAGWGVQEAIKQTGLLEDVSLQGQLFISRIFDTLRWLLGRITFSTVSNTPTAAVAARQRASSALPATPVASHSSGTASGAAGVAAAGAASLGVFGRLRAVMHPGAAAAGAAGVGAAVGAAALAGGSGGSMAAAGRGRLKLRSVTSVDLPRTHRLSLDADESDEHGSDTASECFDDVMDGASSEASCSSSSSWAQQAAAPALTEMPSLTVRVPSSALSGSGSKAGQAKVSFAAEPQLEQQYPATTGDSGATAGNTPFATMRVQQQHHSDIALQHSQQQPKQARSAMAAVIAGDAGSTPTASAASGTRRSSSSSSSSSRRKQQLAGAGPEGLMGAGLHDRRQQRLQRSHSGPAVSVLRDVSSAGQVIRMAGYPLEVHEVVTADGYLLRMERIPLPASTDAVFMMHGVLDTSLTWVAGGITGSQAFAAWDRGFDVWLGTSRCNPPHEAVDPARKGSAYWVYSHNEVGMYDMGAQIDHIHAVKMRELTALGRRASSSSRRASSDANAARASRKPSGRRSSGSTNSKRPIPEHADILAGVVDADALVGVQPLSGGMDTAVPCTGDAPGVAGSGADAQQHHKAGSAPAVQASGDGPTSSNRIVDISRAQSAAEIDQAAAADAAAAFTRHRAALAAAGIGPNITNGTTACALPDQAGQEVVQEQAATQQQQQQQPQPQGILSPMTPRAAATAAARAATALGSAVASAAVAAGGMIGMAVPQATVASQSAAEPDGADPNTDNSTSSGDLSSGCRVAIAEVGRASSPKGSSTTVTARPAASGLLERLLGGTVPAANDDGRLGVRPASLLRLQSQGSGMRHVSSAPDVAALLDPAVPSASAKQQQLAPPAASATAGASTAAGKGSDDDCGEMVSRSSTAQAANSSSSSRRSRRSSWPRFTLSSAAGMLDAWSPSQEHAGLSSDGQQEPQQQQQQQQGDTASKAGAAQQPELSPFSQQPQQQEQQLQQKPPPPPAQAVMSSNQQQPVTAAHSQQQQQQGQQGHRHSRQSDSWDASSPRVGKVASGAAATAGSGATGSAGSRVVRSSSWGVEPRPYNLRVVCHSLGGMLVLMYCTQRARAGRPHHVSRLILLSPAGFHPIIPSMFKPLVYVWRPLMLWTKLVWRQQGFPVHLPTFVARMLAFKLSVDTSKLPAVGDLLRSMARLLLGGDRSAWDRALLMPHYTAAGMPLLSSRQVLHFIQLYLTGRCQLFDYGSEAANVAAYHQRTPPVVSDAYHTLRDVPVHLVAGEHDGVIPASNIRLHYAAMKAAGMDVSYREFDYGHMDFTFSSKEELGWYVMSLLMRT